MANRWMAAVLIAASFCFYAGPASAGTTGSIRGRVTDNATGAGIAGASIKALSPSQSAATITDARGDFIFISLEPDTYSISVQQAGYEPAINTGVSVFSDQTQTVSVALEKQLKTIATTHSRSSNSIVKPGTTGDVYSVNASTQNAVSAAGGAGGLNTAYSAIATAPGVNLPQGQDGWNQIMYVRGGDYGDVSTELDGVPVTREVDFGTATALSSLGQQEVQIYTGGTPASDSSALAGFVNQVIKTGKYPGSGSADLGIGSPQFYHNLSLEAGGASPDRLFSYYLAAQGDDRTYRYANQFNGAGNQLTNWPLSIPSASGLGVYDGSGTPIFTNGSNGYGMHYTQSRESIANFHFGLPHRGDSQRDDVQMLYVTGDIMSSMYSSINDLGMPVNPNGPLFGSYTDTFSYNGPMFAPPNPASVGYYFQPPWTPSQRSFDAPLDSNTRDVDNNVFSIEKIQYQRNFNDHSYLRLLGYAEYTGWSINGPVSSSYLYGGNPQNFEVHSNVFGATAVYSNELNAKNLITATLGYNSQSNLFSNPNNYGTPITYNYVGNDGQCYNPGTGAYSSCFSGAGVIQTPTFSCFDLACAQGYTPGIAPPPAGTPAAAHNAQWLVTESGTTGQFVPIRPYFTSASITDQIRPNDKFLLNLGVRLDNYSYRVTDTSSMFPARQFWFNAWNRENCYTPGEISIAPLGIDPNTGASINPTGQSCVQLVNSQPSSFSQSVLEPRFGMTYTVNPDTVLRASAGIFAQSVPSSSYVWDTYQQNLASYISQFLPLGFNAPYQAKSPEQSASYDLSWEQHLKGTPYSFKITPFYRNTWQQLQAVPVGTQGFVDGVNVGQQRNSGVELLFKSGDFGRDGLSYQLSYTWSHSKVRYGTFGNGQSYVDTLNNYIQQYNSYTGACAGKAPAANVIAARGTTCGLYGGANAFAVEPGSGITNPYYNDTPQPLFDRNAWYTPYDTLPAPFQGATGYETPNVGSLVLSYRKSKLAITPSFTYSSGATYGSPLVWPGYDPNLCAADPALNPANTQQCFGLIFTPDHYTGKFDAQGAFKDPWRFTANLQLEYDLSPKISATLVMTSLIDTCSQRGYAWDNASTCAYSTLPSGHLAPVGNFYPLASAPVQLQYPYGAGGNASYNGQLAQTLPISVFFNVHFKL